jgi:glucose-6-phosphate 1-dehydrogenase
MDFTEILHVSFIPESNFFALMNEVEALPPRKRSKWHKVIQDASGVKHKMYFIDRQLTFKHNSIWIVVKPQGEMDLADTIEYANQSVQRQNERIFAAQQHGGFAAAFQEHERLVEEAATGNHHTKPRKVKIPTAPGQPVRG